MYICIVLELQGTGDDDEDVPDTGMLTEVCRNNIFNLYYLNLVVIKEKYVLGTPGDGEMQAVKSQLKVPVDCDRLSWNSNVVCRC